MIRAEIPHAGVVRWNPGVMQGCNAPGNNSASPVAPVLGDAPEGVVTIHEHQVELALDLGARFVAISLAELDAPLLRCWQPGVARSGLPSRPPTFP